MSMCDAPTRLLSTPTRNAPSTGPDDSESTASPLSSTDLIHCAPSATPICATPQKIVAPRFLNRPTDEAVVQKALTQDIPPLFDYLESQVQAREVIAGTRFSIGDIGICTHFVNMQHAGYEVDAKRWPKLARYVSHVLARPSFKALIEEEAPMFRAA